ncbi:MAG TPA: type II toxin-antitoxin system RelE/ParE family toxin [Acetobacteraceae bacterium]|nr:type II toxin-antitoxin system RelE/ParE family toxin [Acetobacteraceae bacterium]
MATCLRTARAEEDLIDIRLYIASDKPPAANKLLDRIEAAFLLI